MTISRIVNAVGYIAPNVVVEATHAPAPTKKTVWIKWGSMVACLALFLITVFSLPLLLDSSDSLELVYHTGYFYYVEEETLSSYAGGKVIAEDRIGERIAEVTVLAGWKDAEGEWISTERLRGEVHAIVGVSGEVAVALRFIDQGEAVTTTHFYTLLNPNADLTAMKEYIIVDRASANGDALAPIPE